MLRRSMEVVCIESKTFVLSLVVNDAPIASDDDGGDFDGDCNFSFVAQHFV